ncbi:MAG: hypothetical protein ACMXYB_01530 [Candidatus Woesearchaeota archaeon]
MATYAMIKFRIKINEENIMLKNRDVVGSSCNKNLVNKKKREVLRIVKIAISMIKNLF